MKKKSKISHSFRFVHIIIINFIIRIIIVPCHYHSFKVG